MRFFFLYGSVRLRSQFFQYLFLIVIRKRLKGPIRFCQTIRKYGNLQNFARQLNFLISSFEFSLKTFEIFYLLLTPKFWSSKKILTKNGNKSGNKNGLRVHLTILYNFEISESEERAENIFLVQKYFCLDYF